MLFSVSYIKRMIRGCCESLIISSGGVTTVFYKKRFFNFHFSKKIYIAVIFQLFYANNDRFMLFFNNYPQTTLPVILLVSLIFIAISADYRYCL